MISPIDSNEVNDARLVAYLDNELPPSERADVARALEQNSELRERLEFLDGGGRPFASAFDLLLEAAPDDRLQAMFAGLLNAEKETASASATPPPADEKVVPLRRGAPSVLWQMAAAASIALTMFGGGIVTGVVFAPQKTVEPSARGWMEAVAQYVSLFSVQTLAGMPAEAAARDEGLRRVSTALGLDISRDKLDGLPSLEFQGTQLLQLEGKPLAQIAFKSETGKPVAICIIKTPKAPEKAATDRRHGLNIVHWIANGFGFMVIGDETPETLQRISTEAAARFS